MLKIDGLPIARPAGLALVITIVLMANVGVAGLPAHDIPPAPAPLQSSPTPEPFSGDGAITGQVINRTEGASAEVGRTEVRLFALSGEQLADSQTAMTDASGSFDFSNLSTDANLQYVVAARYQGIDYFNRDTLTFEGETTSKSVTIEVYDTTTNPSVIHANRVHIVMDADSGSLQVAELHNFQNVGDRAFVGSDDGQGTLQFFLPAGFEGLQFDDARMENTVIETEDGFIDTLAVRPGTREILFTYSVPYDSGPFRISRTIQYPTAEVDVVAVDGEVNVLAGPLASQGQQETPDGQAFLLLSGQGLNPGTELAFEVTGLPGQSRLPFDPAFLRWFGIGLGAVVVGAALAYPLLRRRWAAGEETQGEASSPAPDLQKQHEDLIQRIADLDDLYEAGEVSDEDYRQKRGKMKAKLIQVTRRLRERS